MATSPEKPSSPFPERRHLSAPPTHGSLGPFLLHPQLPAPLGPVCGVQIKGPSAASSQWSLAIPVPTPLPRAAAIISAPCSSFWINRVGPLSFRFNFLYKYQRAESTLSGGPASVPSRQRPRTPVALEGGHRSPCSPGAQAALPAPSPWRPAKPLHPGPSASHILSHHPFLLSRGIFLFWIFLTAPQRVPASPSRRVIVTLATIPPSLTLTLTSLTLPGVSLPYHSHAH